MPWHSYNFSDKGRAIKGLVVFWMLLNLILLTSIELKEVLPNCYRNHHAKFEIDGTIINLFKLTKRANR